MQTPSSLTPESVPNHCATLMPWEAGKVRVIIYASRGELGEGLAPPQTILFQQQQKCW